MTVEELTPEQAKAISVQLLGSRLGGKSRVFLRDCAESPEGLLVTNGEQGYVPPKGWRFVLLRPRDLGSLGIWRLLGSMWAVEGYFQPSSNWGDTIKGVDRTVEAVLARPRLLGLQPG